MLKRSLFVVMLISCFNSTYTYAEDDDLEHLQVKLTNQWQLIKNDKLHNIKTYAKQEDGRPFRSFKVESTLDGSMNEIVQILANFDHYKKWYWVELPDEEGWVKTISIGNNRCIYKPDKKLINALEILREKHTYHYCKDNPGTTNIFKP